MIMNLKCVAYVWEYLTYILYLQNNQGTILFANSHLTKYHHIELL